MATATKNMAAAWRMARRCCMETAGTRQHRAMFSIERDPGDSNMHQKADDMSGKSKASGNVNEDTAQPTSATEAIGYDAGFRDGYTAGFDHGHKYLESILSSRKKQLQKQDRE
ncbi:hypothetical protein GGF44_000957 [Coemansia sp. RSA 1694]|nr:hypothetical protein GGF44_000957 [Coemansia sp. RSA 1694]